MSSSNWLIPTIILCTYGFLKEMKPSEPFLTPYLNSSFKHIDQKALSDQVYPIATYANFVLLFLVFLATDVLRYKPLIVLESLAYLATRAILVWGDGIPAMQVMQITYGLATATEVAYFSYIYAIVDVRHFQRVTSYTRAVTLFGRGVSGIVGQILVSTDAANYLELNYISFCSVSVGVVVSLFLPKVNTRVFLIGETDGNSEISSQDMAKHDTAAASKYGQEEAQRSPTVCDTWTNNLLAMYHSFKQSYSNRHLLMWSLWWAFAVCGGYQVENYVMNLWATILGPHHDKSHVYNGAVFATGTVLSGIMVTMFSLLKVEWSEVGIGVVSILETALLFIMAYTHNIWVSYICYVVWRISFAFILTVASYQIALHVKKSGYALIFGWNTFIALALQTLLTFIVNDKKGLDLDDREQFIVYGGYFGVIAVVFLTRPSLLLIKRIQESIQKGNDTTPEEVIGNAHVQ